MEILQTRALRGPNLWSRYTALEIEVRCAATELGLEQIPGFEETLRSLFPGVGELRAPGYTGPLTLDQIIDEIAVADAAGHDVARLHSGDPSIYSAVAEQSRRLTDLGIGYEIVPGVPSFTAAAAALGRELTAPGVAQTVILTRVSTLSTAMPEGEDLTTLAAHGATLVIHLAAHRIDTIVPQLLAGGYCPDTPAAVVAFASWPQQVVLRGTLADIAGQIHAAAITRTAVIIVGDVLAAEGFTDSYLYSSGRSRGDRH